MRKTVATLALCALAFVSPNLATAMQVPGSDTPRFEETLTLWLSGEDDARALRAFASLANANNVAAQIFLSQIAVDGALHFHVTTKLARKARVALLKTAGGPFGTSWLLVAAETDPLASAILDANMVGTRRMGVVTLLNAGETLRALRSAVALLHEGRFKALIETLAEVDDLPPEADWLLAQAHETLLSTGEDFGLSQAATRLLETRDLTSVRLRRSAWNPKVPSEVLADFNRGALRDKELSDYSQALGAFCTRHCAGEVQACLRVGDARLAYAAPFPLRSPSETLLSQERYWSSPRMDLDIARPVRSLAGSDVDLSVIGTSFDEAADTLAR